MRLANASGVRTRSLLGVQRVPRTTFDLPAHFAKASRMADDPPRVRDLYRYNDSSNSMDLAATDRRFEQLLERRDRLIERSRFGLLALNGASIIGIISSFDKLKATAGMDPRFPMAFFVVGMILAIVSIYFETQFTNARSAHTFVHLSRLRTIRSTLDDSLNDEASQRLSDQLKAMSVISKREGSDITLDDDRDGLPNDFAFSQAALVTLNFAGGAWIGGVTAMIVDLFR